MSLSICLSVCPSVRLSLAVTSRTVVGSLWTVAAGGIQLLGSANHRTADWDANLETETRRHADGQTDRQRDTDHGRQSADRSTTTIPFCFSSSVRQFGVARRKLAMLSISVAVYTDSQLDDVSAQSPPAGRVNCNT